MTMEKIYIIPAAKYPFWLEFCAISINLVVILCCFFMSIATCLCRHSVKRTNNVSTRTKSFCMLIFLIFTRKRMQWNDTKVSSIHGVFNTNYVDMQSKYSNVWGNCNYFTAQGIVFDTVESWFPISFCLLIHILTLLSYFDADYPDADSVCK